MNKSEFWERIWIDIKTRIPPPEDFFILIWNPVWRCPFVMRAYEAHQAGMAILRSEPVSQDRFFTKWCPIVSPIKTQGEKNVGNSRAAKGRRTPPKRPM